MIKLNVCIFLFVVSQLAAAQIQKKPVIDVGISYRNHAIVLADKPVVTNPYGFYWSSVHHFRVASLAIDIKQNVFNKHCYIELSNYFRYGHFRYENSQSGGLGKEIKKFKHDHFLDFLYEFGRHKPHHVIFMLGAGVGYMNLGTRFNYNYHKGNDASGNPVIISTDGSFSFIAPRLILGVRKNNIQGFIIVHGTPDEEYEPNPTLWIEGKATYSFHLSKRKRK